MYNFMFTNGTRFQVQKIISEEVTTLAATVNFAGNHNLLKSTRESVKDSFDSQEQGFEIADKNITQSRLQTAMVHRAKSLMSRLKIEKPSNHSIAYTLQKRALGLFLWFLRWF